jgi:predicted metal-dependent peptidase
MNLRAKLDATRLKFNQSKTYAMLTAWAMHLPDVVKDDLPYPTAATDGTTIYWHPEYVENNTIDTLVLTLAHEITHCILYHCAGRGKWLVKKYSPELANMALDHAVNNFLRDAGQRIPSDWIFDKKYRGWSAEEIAKDLHDNNDKTQPEPQQGEGSGQGGGHEMMENATPDKTAEAQATADGAHADTSIMDAMKKAQGLEGEGDGQGDTSMGGLLDQARNNRHKARDWRDELSEFMGSVKDGDRVSTYSRITRRPIPNIIRAGKRRVGSPHIAVILDTSGSMYRDLPKVMVELEVMSDDGYTFDVVCCDGGVTGPHHFDAHEFDHSALPLEGGGGSNMRPAFDRVHEMCPDADAMVFCTDGCIEWPKRSVLDQLPPCILVEFRSRKSKQGERFNKHILIKD